MSAVNGERDIKANGVDTPATYDATRPAFASATHYSASANILRPEASMSDLFRSAAELTWLRKFGLTESAARRASLVLYPIDPRFPVEQAFANSAQELALEFARDSRRVTDGPELEAMAVEKLNALMRFAWLFQNSDYVRIYGGALGRDFYFTDPRPVGDSLDRDDMFLFLDYVNNAEGESDVQLLKDVRDDPFLGRAYAEWSDEQLLAQLREIRSW